MLRSTRIPQDRIGAFVGKNGSSKKALEERTHMKFDIDKQPHPLGLTVQARPGVRVRGLNQP